MNNEEFQAYCMKWTKFWHTVIVGIVLGCCFLVVPVAIWENNKHNEELKNCLVEETRTPNCSLLLFNEVKNKTKVYIILPDTEQKTVDIDENQVDKVLEMLQQSQKEIYERK